eukprot:509079_1
MEAGYGLVNKSKMMTTTWDGDWESFKQTFEATADLNGLNEAVIVGQLLAEDQITWPWIQIKAERSSEVAAAKVERSYKVAAAKVERSCEVAAKESLMKGATVQSHRLASMLILSLLDSTGVQRSIVGDRLRYQKDGVRAWADLVLHFETSSKDLRVESLTKKWDKATLEAGEHPDQLWTRLASINQNLKKLGEEFKESHFMRRFIAGIKTQPGHPYKQVLTMYKGTVIAGSPLKINQMRELLSETYEDEKAANGRGTEENMKGFIVFKVCQVCKKKGHTKESSWVAHPDKKPKAANINDRHARGNKEPRIICWSCGEPGHTKKECMKRSSTNPQGIAAAIASPPIMKNKPIYVDSACSCHLMVDVKYFEPNTTTRTAETITAVGGQKIDLTQKGTVKIPTADGMLTLT